jgi:hypothetical protein
MHPKTIERAARIIVDIDGAYERSGRALSDLLRNSGWSDPPDYDGSARIPWLVDVMLERGGDQAALERLFCQVCNPVEYDDGMTAAQVMQQELNKILEHEGLVISFWSGKPIMGRRDEDTSGIIFTAPEDLSSRLRELISDGATVEWLLARAKETQICESSGAYIFALVGIGSFVEYLLLSVLSEWDHDARVRGLTDERGRNVPLDRVSFDLLIKTVHARGWIQLDAKDFINQVRQYRNLVHLRLQSETGLAPDRDTVMMCWAPVRAVINDLEAVAARMKSEA